MEMMAPNTQALIIEVIRSQAVIALTQECQNDHRGHVIDQLRNHHAACDPCNMVQRRLGLTSTAYLTSRPCYLRQRTRQHLITYNDAVKH